MKLSIRMVGMATLLFGVAIAAWGGEANSPKLDEPSTKHASQIKLVVLDPGHGGHDPGATGPGGVLEKDVVLEVAKRMKVGLEKNLHVKVALTREDDVFIPLRDRAAMANGMGADLFVSIHANAARRRAWGFETYFLSATASDVESRKLALKENYPLEPPPDMNTELPPEVSSDLEAIFFDMAQTEYIRESESLAMIIQDHLAAILNSPDRGVKQAPFMVLTGAAMPAVLVEIGFVSSRREVILLTDPAMQDKIAEALAASVKEFAKRRLRRSQHAPPQPAH